MRLVFVTQTVDVDDPILGATVAKLRALAARCDALDVVCARVGRHDLPPNVSFRSFAAPTRLGRGLRYTRAIAPLLAQRPRPDALLAHMCPIYLVLAAPLAKPLRVPLVLWYTHWTLGRTLRLATALSDLALSVDTRSFPMESPKVLGIGHGIDTAEFPPRHSLPARSDGALRLLALGRTSPSKGFETLLRGLERAADAGVEAALELRGPSTTEEERAHRRRLEQLIESPQLRGRVRLEPPVPRGDVPDLVRGFDAVVNPTRGQTSGGALDKVVYEAAACGVPVIACNPHFDEFLGGLPLELRFASEDPADLARVLRAFAESGDETREAVGRELRRRVEAGHSAETWAEAVVRAVREIRR